MFSRARLVQVLKAIVVSGFMALEFSCTAADHALSVTPGQTITELMTVMDGRGVLKFEGSSGLFLMVNRASIENSSLDERDKLILLPPGTGEAEGILMSQTMSLASGWGPFPKQASINSFCCALRTSPTGLRLTLMEPHDPRLDPGTSPDRVSIDTAILGTTSVLSPQSFYPPTFAGVDDNWPAQLEFVTKRLQIRIMSVEGIKKTFWEDDAWIQSLGRLESALRPGAVAVSPDVLPLALFQDSALCYWGKEERFESKSWQGLRWVSLYEQGCGGDEWLSPLPMNYVFEAISRDGRYFILVFADIVDLRPPLKWKTMLNESPSSNRLTNQKAEEEYEKRLRGLVSRHFDDSSLDSFKPDLRQLDSVVRSIELR